ncbi:MAG: hypothetical protein ACK46X_16200 [Candidatus Sericytochromatia bacterium]
MRHLVLPALALTALAACQQAPPLVPVVAVGSAAPIVGTNQAPDAPTLQLAAAGAHTALALGPAVAQLAQLAGAFYESRTKHTRYRVMSGPEGWDFRHGWYARTDSTPDHALRARFEDPTGAPPAFDVTFDVNYGPDMHPGFPANLARMRAELDHQLPSGGKVSLTLVGNLPPNRTERVMATGSGAIAAPAPLTQVGLEALNATFTPFGAAERGDLVLKSLSGGVTLQLSGHYNAEGLEGTAQVLHNATAIGEVGRFDGKWQFRNLSGMYPL